MPKSDKEIAHYVVDELNNVINIDKFSNLIRRNFRCCTSHVKDIFYKLGRSLNYTVSPGMNGEFQNREWLYDLCWYIERDGKFIELKLALESELSPGGSVNDAHLVDGDFQKLVQSRAGVRVWLSALPNNYLMEIHIKNCKDQISLFNATVPGDIYIFAIFNWTTNKMIVELYESP